MYYTLLQRVGDPLRTSVLWCREGLNNPFYTRRVPSLYVWRDLPSHGMFSGSFLPPPPAFTDSADPSLAPTLYSLAVWSRSGWTCGQGIETGGCSPLMPYPEKTQHTILEQSFLSLTQEKALQCVLWLSWNLSHGFSFRIILGDQAKILPTCDLGFLKAKVRFSSEFSLGQDGPLFLLSVVSLQT